MSIFKKETGSNRPQPYSVGPLSMVPMKWKQYKNLTEAEKNNGTMYHITDKSFDKPDASDISYDGETSGSEETNVQDELDKLEAVTGQLNTDLSELFVPSITITADGSKTVRTLLNELYSQIDRSKVTVHSKLCFDTYILSIDRDQPAGIFYSATRVYSHGSEELQTVYLTPSASDFSAGRIGSITSLNSYVYASGTKFYFYY